MKFTLQHRLGGEKNLQRLVTYLLVKIKFCAALAPRTTKYQKYRTTTERKDTKTVERSKNAELNSSIKVLMSDTYLLIFGVAIAKWLSWV